eukprot:1086071-Rhodomonas_salina.1
MPRVARSHHVPASRDSPQRAGDPERTDQGRPIFLHSLCFDPTPALREILKRWSRLIPAAGFRHPRAQQLLRHCRSVLAAGYPPGKPPTLRHFPCSPVHTHWKTSAHLWEDQCTLVGRLVHTRGKTSAHSWEDG